MFEKLDRVNFPYTAKHNLFTKVAIFDFELICVTTDELKVTKTTAWIGKHVPISVSISSILQDDPIFVLKRSRIPDNCICFLLEVLAEKSNLKKRTKFEDIENTVIDRVKNIFEKLNAGTLIKF